METVNIDNLSLSELKDLLKEVKLYKDLKTQLGERGRKVYSKLKTGEKTLSVEYFPTISKDLAFSESKKIFKNIFNLDVEEKDVKMKENEKIKGGIRVYMDDKVAEKDVKMKENEKIKGGIRVYMDDKVADLSYLKIERNLSK